MTNKEQAFVRKVREFYSTYGRHDLPWRKTTDPYKVAVSEVMLQQTQVDRVIPKYTEFLEKFPTAHDLSEAHLRDVLVLWQGLGYNRRAKLLYEMAQTITTLHGGVFPNDHHALQSLPGVGPYTAGAIMAFAYNKPQPIIETNIRTAYLHHFFKKKDDVHDADVLIYIARTLDTHNIREWYWAVMDYGAHIKKTQGNQNVRSKTYVRQTPFVGSARQVRGALVRTLVRERYTQRQLIQELSDLDTELIESQLRALLDEGLIERRGRYYSVPE